MTTGKEYDKELFEFDTQTRQELYNLDNGALPDRGEVTSDRSVRDGHDYRQLLNAYNSLGLEIDETDTRGPRPFRENVEFDNPEVLKVAFEDRFEELMVSENEESVFIENDGRYRDLKDLVDTLRKTKSIEAVRKNRRRINGLVSSRFEKDMADLSIMEVDCICKERVKVIAGIRQKRSLLRFNDKVVKDVMKDMRKALRLHRFASAADIESALRKKKVSNKKIYNWMARLQSLKIPGVTAESNELNERREKQLGKINGLLTKLDAKLAPVRERREAENARQEKQKKRNQERERLAREMIMYLQEKAETDQAMRPLREEVKKKGKVDWKTLKELNRDAYEASFGMLAFFQHLRETDPDLMLQLYPKIAHLDKSVKQAYDQVLKTFIRTHNSFNFSPEAMAECQKHNPPLARLLNKMLRARPEDDQEREFHQAVTKLPKKVLDRHFETSN